MRNSALLLPLFCMTLAACQTSPLTTSVETKTVNVPVAIPCVTQDALPQSHFVPNGTIDQDAASASLELREWRRFGKAVVQQCSPQKE